jgi:hypothetical protein
VIQSHITDLSIHSIFLNGRNQVLTLDQWYALLRKLQEEYVLQDIIPTSVESIYTDIIAKQYNLQYLDHEKLRKERVKYVPLLPIPT